MLLLDLAKRRFTLLWPIHIDLYGGIVKIIATIATNSPVESVKGISTPLVGLRWQPDDPNARIDEMHYTIDGCWAAGNGKVHGFDLWDADLNSIKPMSKVELKVVANA